MYINVTCVVSCVYHNTERVFTMYVHYVIFVCEWVSVIANEYNDWFR